MSSEPLGKCLAVSDTCLMDRLLRPVRYIMARLLKPMLGREEELFASLDIHLERIEQQQRQLAALVQQVGPADTKERLINFEARLQQLEGTGARSVR
jgi:hypothetical protein